jgi:SAM-dependent methyltransferase
VGFNTLMLPLSLRSNLPAFLGRGEVDERSREADREWPIYDHDIICQRYNRIAAFIPFFEYAFFMPSGLRKRAVDQLKLRQGDRVLEVGCGTGRNFQFLRDAVGPEGRIYGVDLSEGMLRRARKLCQRRQWTNFGLIKADAADYASQELFDSALLAFPITLCRTIVLFFAKFGNSFVPAADSLSWMQDYPQGSWES